MAEVARKKSPRAPSLSLSEALDKAIRVYDSEHLHPAPTDVVAAAMGYKSANNGTALSTIASLRYFGLLDRPKDGFLVVSKAVESFKFAPSEELRRELAFQFLKSPPLYAELIEQYASGLPSDANLKYELIQRGFLPANVSSVLSAFKQSVDFTGYYEHRQYRSGSPAIDQEIDTHSEIDDPSPVSSSRVTNVVESQKTSPAISNVLDNETMDKIPVRLAGGRRAWLIIPEPFYSADKVRLKAQIDLLLAEDEQI